MKIDRIAFLSLTCALASTATPTVVHADAPAKDPLTAPVSHQWRWDGEEWKAHETPFCGAAHTDGLKGHAPPPVPTAEGGAPLQAPTAEGGASLQAPTAEGGAPLPQAWYYRHLFGAYASHQTFPLSTGTILWTNVPVRDVRLTTTLVTLPDGKKAYRFTDRVLPERTSFTGHYWLAYDGGSVVLHMQYDGGAHETSLLAPEAIANGGASMQHPARKSMIQSMRKVACPNAPELAAPPAPKHAATGHAATWLLGAELVAIDAASDFPRLVFTKAEVPRTNQWRLDATRRVSMSASQPKQERADVGRYELREAGAAGPAQITLISAHYKFPGQTAATHTWSPAKREDMRAAFTLKLEGCKATLTSVKPRLDTHAVEVLRFTKKGCEADAP